MFRKISGLLKFLNIAGVNNKITPTKYLTGWHLIYLVCAISLLRPLNIFQKILKTIYLDCHLSLYILVQLIISVKSIIKATTDAGHTFQTCLNELCE